MPGGRPREPGPQAARSGTEALGGSGRAWSPRSRPHGGRTAAFQLHGDGCSTRSLRAGVAIECVSSVISVACAARAEAESLQGRKILFLRGAREERN